MKIILGKGNWEESMDRKKRIIRNEKKGGREDNDKGDGDESREEGEGKVEEER